jgi:hypothetical protein
MISELGTNRIEAIRAARKRAEAPPMEDGDVATEASEGAPEPQAAQEDGIQGSTAEIVVEDGAVTQVVTTNEGTGSHEGQAEAVRSEAEDAEAEIDPAILTYRAEINTAESYDEMMQAIAKVRKTPVYEDHDIRDQLKVTAYRRAVLIRPTVSTTEQAKLDPAMSPFMMELMIADADVPADEITEARRSLIRTTAYKGLTDEQKDGLADRIEAALGRRR